MSDHHFRWSEARALSVCAICGLATDVVLDGGRPVRRYLVAGAWVVEPPACVTVCEAMPVAGAVRPALPYRERTAAERADAAWFYDRVVVTMPVYRIGATELVPELLTSAETIDGAVVDHMVGCVDLGVEFTPVLPFRGSICPCDATLLEDGTYRLGPNDMSGQPVMCGFWMTPLAVVGPRTLRKMRARYLLQRDAFHKALHTLYPYSYQRAVTSWYFPNGVWVPAEASPLPAARGVPR